MADTTSPLPEFDAGEVRPSRDTEEIIKKIAELLLKAVQEAMPGKHSDPKGIDGGKLAMPEFDHDARVGGEEGPPPLSEFADGPVFAGGEDGVEKREAGKAWDRRLRLWRRGLGPHPGAPPKAPRVPREPKDEVGDEVPEAPGVPRDDDVAPIMELPDLPVVIPDFPAMPPEPGRVKDAAASRGGAPVEDVDSLMVLTESYAAPPVPEIPTSEPIQQTTPSPPVATVPVAPAQAPPVPEIPGTVPPPKIETKDTGWTHDEIEDVFRRETGPKIPVPEIPKTPPPPPIRNPTPDDPQGYKRYIDEQQSQEIGVRGVVDSMLNWQEEAHKRANTVQSLMMDYMERLAGDNNNDERRIRDMNSSLQRSRTTMTDVHI